MKKLLLVITIMTLSCSSNDTPAAPAADTTTTDCNCGRIVRSGAFTTVNTPGSPTPTTTFTTYVVLNNCSNLERTFQVNGNQQATYPVGKYICN